MEKLGENDNLMRFRCEALLKSAIISETDLEGNILFANDEFVNALGYSRKEIIGKNHRILNSKTHHPEFFKGIFKAATMGKIWKGTVEDFTKKGKRIWLDTSIVPILNKKGKPIRYLAVRFDVTKFMEK
ncbi:MAG: PAS domain S-box protein [archaeon]|nr:PAS domain S-box protein [archaeon]